MEAHLSYGEFNCIDVVDFIKYSTIVIHDVLIIKLITLQL